MFKTENNPTSVRTSQIRQVRKRGPEANIEIGRATAQRCPMEWVIHTHNSERVRMCTQATAALPGSGETIPAQPIRVPRRSPAALSSSASEAKHPLSAAQDPTSPTTACAEQPGSRPGYPPPNNIYHLKCNHFLSFTLQPFPLLHTSA